jgi:hypothetical protein
MASAAVLAACAATAAWSPTWSPAWAHGQKTKSDPADGATVASIERAVLHFDEAVRLTNVTLTDGSGAEVALPQSRSLEPEAEKAVALPDDLAPGDYRMEWQALSADGHPIEGGFGFTLRP